MSRHNEIQNAYRSLGKEATFYDGMITCSTLPGRVICGLVWNMGQEKNTRYLEKALDCVPDGFSGKLLEVPVGTGVLTIPVYKTLPFENGSFDFVLSLNGFHAFPDKEAAYREILRVLRPGGVFCGRFYVKGENRRTDWFVEKIYTPKGHSGKAGVLSDCCGSACGNTPNIQRSGYLSLRLCDQLPALAGGGLVRRVGHRLSVVLPQQAVHHPRHRGYDTGIPRLWIPHPAILYRDIHRFAGVSI